MGFICMAISPSSLLSGSLASSGTQNLLNRIIDFPLFESLIFAPLLCFFAGLAVGLDPAFPQQLNPNLSCPPRADDFLRITDHGTTKCSIPRPTSAIPIKVNPHSRNGRRPGANDTFSVKYYINLVLVTGCDRGEPSDGGGVLKLKVQFELRSIVLQPIQISFCSVRSLVGRS